MKLLLSALLLMAVPAYADLTQDQIANHELTRQIIVEVGASVPEATASLTSAAGNMGRTEASLGAKQVHTAVPTAREALDDLYRAKKALDEKIAALNHELGQDHPPPPADYEKTERDIDQAIGDLDKSRTPEDLGKVSDQIKGISSKDDLPKGAQQPLNDADRSLNNPGQKPKDQKAQAGQALEKAKAMVRMARNGMMPGQLPSDSPAMVSSGKPIPGTGERKDSTVRTDSTVDGRATERHGDFISLPPRDRKALEQSQTDKAPAEYSSQVAQYLQNLSERLK